MSVLLTNLIGNEYFKSIGVNDHTEFNQIKDQLILKDAFQILGVANTASIDEIKSAYRKLALQFHPDRYCPRQAQKYNGYDVNEIKQLAESVMHVINTAYVALLNSKEDNNLEQTSTKAASARSKVSPVVFRPTPHPAKIEKKSVRDFITKMKDKISDVIEKSTDKEKDQQVIQAMQELQAKINGNRDLLLPELQPSPTSGDNMALQKNIGADYLLSKNYQVFVLECLSDVKAVEKELGELDADLSSDSLAYYWQVAIDCLKFLLQKMYKLLTCDSTPVYKDGLYNGLFSSTKVNASNALNKIESNLTQEKKMTEFDERASESACMTGRAVWFN